MMNAASGSSGLTMSNIQKVDQIAFHFYTKLFNVVNHGRTTSALPTKLDKWFNLEVPDSDLFTKEARDPYRSISTTPQPEALRIQVLLTIPELATNQVLVHTSADSSRNRIYPTPRYILLEEYTLDFIRAYSESDVPPPTIYKHGIPLFRSLFTLLRLLPAWKLHKRLRRRLGGGNVLGIVVRVREGDDHDVLSLMQSSQADTHTFSAVPHPFGSLALTVTYLTEPNFQIDELESLLSSRFFHLDQRPFTPTLAKNKSLRDSISSTSSPPSSRSPPRASTSTSHSSGPHSHSSSGIPLPLPDRGPRPPPPRNVTALTRPLTSSTQQQPSPSGLSSTRAQLLRQQEGAAALTGALSSSSLSPTSSFTAPGATSNSAVGGTSTSAEAGSANNSFGSPSTPARKPQPQYPFPFKSNTLVPSSSSSPIAGIPSSVGSGSSIPSSISDRIGLNAAATGDRERVNSLPQPSGLGLGLTLNDPVTSGSLSRANIATGNGVSSTRHSRPGSISKAPSMRERSTSRPPAGADAAGDAGIPGATGTSAPRKRYSSSFGHRYAASASAMGTPGSVGSGGMSDEARERRISIGYPIVGSQASPRSPHPHSPLSPSPSSSTSFPRGFPHPRHADDDDLSEMIQDIDKRKPLTGRTKSSQPPSLSSSPSNKSGFESSPFPKQGENKLTSSPRSGERQLASAYTPPPVTNRLSPRQRTIPLSPLSSEAQVHTMSMAQSPPPPSQPIAISPPGGRVLTSEAEIDERLRKMNETFLKSLEGLGSGGGSGSGSASSSRPLTRSGSPSLGGNQTSSSSVNNVRLGPSHTRNRSLNEGSPLASRSSGLGLTTEGSGGAPLPLPPSFRRQGSQEIIGTMEMEDDEEGGGNRGAFDYELTRARGRGTGSRFTF